MTKSASLLICFSLTLGGLSLARQARPDRAHDLWLQERYFEATSVKNGMTRADLLKVFRMDGGLQRHLPTRYVLKSSDFIKVDVEFEGPPSAKDKIILPEDLRPEMESPASDSGGNPGLLERNYLFLPNEQLKIKSMSRPYIEQVNYN